MDVPAQFRYDPRREMIAILWALAVGLGVAPVAGYFPRKLGIAISLCFTGLGVLIAMRRYVFSRTLAIDEEGIWLPSGFMRMNVRRVSFAEVTGVWEAFLPLTVVLCLRWHGKTLELISTFLPDHESYLTVGRYIYSRIESLQE